MAEPESALVGRIQQLLAADGMHGDGLARHGVGRLVEQRAQQHAHAFDEAHLAHADRIAELAAAALGLHGRGRRRGGLGRGGAGQGQAVGRHVGIHGGPRIHNVHYTV